MNFWLLLKKLERIITDRVRNPHKMRMIWDVLQIFYVTFLI